MVYRYLLGSRFYVHSHDSTHPNGRPVIEMDKRGILIVVCHGYFERELKCITPAGLGKKGSCAFLCEHGSSVEVGELEDAMDELADPKKQNTNGGFWHNSTGSSGLVYDYTLSKELDKTAKKNYKKKADYRFCDSSYLEAIYPHDAPFDIIGLHNAWNSGRTVKLSTLFNTLQENCPGRYTHLYCGFCRESQ